MIHALSPLSHGQRWIVGWCPREIRDDVARGHEKGLYFPYNSLHARQPSSQLILEGGERGREAAYSSGSIWWSLSHIPQRKERFLMSFCIRRSIVFSEKNKYCCCDTSFVASSTARRHSTDTGGNERDAKVRHFGAPSMEDLRLLTCVR